MASRRRHDDGHNTNLLLSKLNTISHGARELVNGKQELPFSNAQMKLCFKAYSKINLGREDMQFDAFAALKPTTARAELAAVFGLIDQDRDGSIIVEEFVSGLSLMCQGTAHERLSLVFHLYNADSNGVLVKDDIDALLDVLDSKRAILSNTTPQPRTPESREKIYTELIKRKVLAAAPARTLNRFRKAQSKIKVIQALSHMSQSTVAFRHTPSDTSSDRKYAADIAASMAGQEDKASENKTIMAAAASAAAALKGRPPMLSSMAVTNSDQISRSSRRLADIRHVDIPDDMTIDTLSITVEKFIDVMEEDELSQQFLDSVINSFNKIVYAGINNPQAGWDDDGKKNAGQLSMLAAMGQSLSTIGRQITRSFKVDSPSKSQRIHTEN